jgi:5-methyltetrahydrofolate--homocysteine methyltransferase
LSDEALAEADVRHKNMNILDEIKSGKILLSDGALGTMLQSQGLKPGECPELWNITHRDVLKEIAELYIRAGSDIISTNSFGGSRIKLSQYGLADRTSEINQAAAEIYREAAGSEGHVAGSMGPTGKMLLMGDITQEEMFDAFCEQAGSLEKGGADIIIVETMSDSDEAALAVKAARSVTKCTVIVTMTFSKDSNNGYYTMMGVSPEEMTIRMKESGAHIIGSNCGNGIRDMIGIAKAIRSADLNIPLIIQANAGMPDLVDGKTIFHESPEMMSSYIPELISAGVNIIGGCCGTTPAHIMEIARVIGR